MLDIHHRLLWKGLQGSSEIVWKVRYLYLLGLKEGAYKVCYESYKTYLQ